MLNKVMLIGRLGRDPEIRYAANGTPIANLRLATDESYTDRDGNKVERTEWHTVVVFQRQAENCKTYLGKGSLIFVEGSLQTRKWQDQNGQDRYSTEIKAQRVQFLDRRSAAGTANVGNEDGQGAYESAPKSYGSGQSYGQPRQSQPQGGRRQPGGPLNDPMDDLGPAFPSEASGMDDVPF